MSAVLVALLLQAAPLDAGVDVVGQALVAEVARAKALSMATSPGAKVERPYYLAAFFNEAQTFDAWASFGALASRVEATNYSVATRVRVGSATFDNTGFQDSSFSLAEGRRPRPMPGELDPDLLRHTLWLALDDAYKQAVETLAKKRAFLLTNAVLDPIDDFSSAPPFIIDRPRVPLQVEGEKTAALVRRVSAVFLDNPVLQEGTAWYRAASTEQHFASSEGVTHRFGEAQVSLQLAVMAQASDGMELRLMQRFSGQDEADLPAEPELVTAAQQLSTRMTALAKAPLADEDYAGPVLFVDQAAALFFLATLGEPLSNPREPLGARQRGRMVDRLGKRVANKALSAVDDPTVTRWLVGQREVPLWGAFPVDDDGVQPQRVSLVEDGVLRSYYMSRTPTAGLKQSNGHCRGEQGAVGNLFIRTSQPVARVAMKRRLLELAREEDLDYGLMVESAGEALPREGLSNPVVVWRVYADGREVLVRGLTFKPISARVLKELEAVGDEPFVLNLEHRGQRTSVIAPGVLVKLMELTRPRAEFERPPLLPRP
jgi:TldD protein